MNDVALETQHIHCNLNIAPVCVNDSTIEALIDSGALHNFVSKSLVQRVQRQTSTLDQLVVQMADHLKAFSTAICSAYLRICVITSVEIFYV